jgi:undecaprenyl-diphosphatase
MVAVTSTGNLGLIWIFSALILMALDAPRRQLGYSMLIALLFCITIGNLIIKNVVKRNSPFFHKNYKLLIKQPWDYSFPSGHTLSSFAAATVLFYMNGDIGIIAFIYASLIALSRLYLRVHFFTDVFFSMVLGTGLGILAVKAYETRFFGLI